MKTYSNIYYLCKSCDKVYDSFGKEYKGDINKDKLLKGNCEKCYKEGLKKLEKKIC